jgi:predicted metal-binding protein
LSGTDPKGRKEHGRSDRDLKKEMLELVDDSGANITYERYTNSVDVSDFECAIQYKELCAACPEHGKRLSCPPFSPSFPEHVGKAQRARVICVRFPREYFSHLASDKDYLTRFFRKAGSLLADILLDYRAKGYVIAGSGPCLACERCASDAGLETCSKPDKQIYSLESLGVNVAALCKKAFDLDLEWSSDGRAADHVCAVGAVFFSD